MVGSKANKQSRVLQILLAPVRVLQKARDFYMKGMMDCAGRVDYDGIISGPTSELLPLPKSFSINPSKANDDEEFKEMLRVLSNKRSDQMELKLQVREGDVKGTTTTRTNGMGIKSYSVGLGKIGVIDEDKPCSFREADDKEADMYARSRSHAVRRNVVSY